MLREVVHLVRNVPRSLALIARGSQADVYETAMGAADEAGLAAQRAALTAGLSGRVLEIGSGTGRMFQYYPPEVELVAVEPDESFTERARPAKERAACRIELVEGSAERLPFDDASFDAAVIALVLCSVEDPRKVLDELYRVVRPGGQVRILEHVVSDRKVPAALMHAFDPLWLRLNNQGCHMDRDPLPAIEAAGFVVERTEAFQVFANYLPAFPMRRFDARRS